MKDYPLRLGLTLWSHNQWQHTVYGKGTKPAERLAKYAQYFHTVEGNTTFYATPNLATARNWRDATPDDFRFTFKLPQQITHRQLLHNCRGELNDFLSAMAPVVEKVGQWTIQLPASFGFEHLEQLKTFCHAFPRELPLGVEVRHPIFFAKGPEELALNHWLIEQKIDRVIMDSRPVFAAPPTTPAVVDAHQKKPKVPVHAIATASRPMIRFIGHPELDENLDFYTPWLNKIPAWISQGIQPYLMIHTPDNVLAPELALSLYQALENTMEANKLPPIVPLLESNASSQFDLF
ncbi:DUF72 domain-containing protein [Vibrio sp. WXL210]|uniref:DUF72 domain-containing protein n=1 Tax=Vibrio sp. WXL210 TaxID=3450709 RepID=UPI003EC737D8